MTTSTRIVGSWKLIVHTDHLTFGGGLLIWSIWLCIYNGLCTLNGLRYYTRSRFAGCMYESLYEKFWGVWSCVMLHVIVCQLALSLPSKLSACGAIAVIHDFSFCMHYSITKSRMDEALSKRLIFTFHLLPLIYYYLMHFGSGAFLFIFIWADHLSLIGHLGQGITDGPQFFVCFLHLPCSPFPLCKWFEYNLFYSTQSSETLWWKLEGWRSFDGHLLECRNNWISSCYPQPTS